MSYIVIVDMDQPGNRMFVGLRTENEFELAEFDNVGKVKLLKIEHALGVFEWLVIGVRGDASIDVLY